jgi:DNA polymerase III beta subunit-like protein/Fic/DOC family protein
VFFSLAENNWVNIKAGRSKTKMIGMAASNFPVLPAFPAAGIDVPIPIFSALIQKTIFAVSDQEIRYTLGGTQFEISPEGVAMVATDGHRLGYLKIDKPLPGITGATKLLIPKKTLGTLMALLTPYEDGMVTFAHDDNSLFFRIANKTLSARKMTGQFPNYAAVLPKDQTISVVIDSNALRNSLFVHLQNAIVDPRYAQVDWRTNQNFVSQTLPDYSEEVHFVCPKPGDIPDLMNSWMEMVRRLEISEGPDPVIAAAVTAFGFVFIHPFDDGNGRIHRFLVHHILAKLGFTPPGILFPVSAAMLRNRIAYDQVLERFSLSIMPFIDHDLDPERGMTVHNETVHLYRYFDATAQAEYLYQCIEETIHRDLRDEIGFLAVFDTALRAVLNIVDMPNRRASLLIRLILQNKGKLSKSKRASFSELTDEEISRIEGAVWKAWENAHHSPNPTEP